MKYTSEYGKVVNEKDPWHVRFYDTENKLLTSTLHYTDAAETFTPVLPFSFVRRASDYSRSFPAVFTLSANEKIFGCGESFQSFDKRGQKVVLWVDDANGVQNETMYKPVPSYISSRGYGVFMHTSTPITCDFGQYYSGANANEDAVLDLSNHEAVSWYQGKIKGLLDKGVSVIKVDFGEAAPAEGVYASGRTGFYEHNLYPLRYNKAVSDITREVTGERIIWARSTWAGSQRYPLHWGGDPANTNTAMAATLRGGLSLGVSGFSFWSHDIGGFVHRTPEDSYRRWTPFGMLTSHVHSHGAPPKETWEYADDFLDAFRMADEMKYKLMPYIYAQSRECAENGWPMLRALFVEYPDDPYNGKVRYKITG